MLNKQDKQKKTSKLKSAKLWVTIWAVIMVTYIVVANRSEFNQIAQWLCAVPLAYIGANVYQKKIFADLEEKIGGE
jgi:amino acid permease